MHTAAHVLIVVGLLGVLEFSALVFSARQLAGTTAPRLRRRIDSPLVHGAPTWTACSVALVIVGLVLAAN